MLRVSPAMIVPQTTQPVQHTISAANEQCIILSVLFDEYTQQILKLHADDCPSDHSNCNCFIRIQTIAPNAILFSHGSSGGDRSAHE
jgi:hypothetical protein